MRSPGRGGNKLGRDFWLYFSGQLVSQAGTSFTNFALPLLVFKLTGSATGLALTTAAELVPYLLFGLVLGALTDRLDRRRMMLLTDAGRAVMILALPALALAGTLQAADIYAVAFAFSPVRHGDRYLADAAGAASATAAEALPD